MRNHPDESLIVLLQQKRTHLLNLKSRWTNVLASSAQFDAHLKSAQIIRSAFSLPEPSCGGVPAESVAHIKADPYGDDLEFESDDFDLDVPEFGLPESETVILNDILVDDGDADAQADEIVVDVGEFDIPLIWAVPVSFHSSVV